MRVQSDITVRAITVLFILLLVSGLAACGSSGDSFTTAESGTFDESSQDARMERKETLLGSSDSTTTQGMGMAAESDVESEEAEEPAQSAADSDDGGSAGFFQNAPLGDEAQASVLPQQRIIVRTVDMGMIVPDVPQAADEILGSTRRLGGWLVNADRSRTHQASLSVRVPAESLDGFIDSVRDMAERVEYETSSSQDVTDQYVDNEARLNGLRRTEERLFEFLERAADVEDALEVQRELAAIQLEMETIQGRLRFLSQTAAYSLVNLALTTRPGEMPVEIGQDTATYRAGLPGTFRATFEAPEEVEEFRFTWDFGDGSRPIEGSRTAPTTNPGERVTSTVSHAFEDLEQSPYIVQLEISGIGEAGVFRGSDTLIATVTEIPGIEVFAGEGRVVDEGDEVEYSGSFTRPAELWDFEFRWDFGDGTSTVAGAPADGATRVTAVHTFSDYRPDPYQVVLTLTARSEAGEVKGSGTFYVDVNEVEGFVVAGWDVGGTAKSAVRVLTAVGQVLVIVIIWVGILSPVWLAILAVFILFPRMRRRFGGAPGGWSLPRRQRGWDTSTSQQVDSERAESAGGSSEAPFHPPEGSTSSGDEDSPAVVCRQCGREIPGNDPIGNPPRFCPFCGTETGQC